MAQKTFLTFSDQIQGNAYLIIVDLKRRQKHCRGKTDDWSGLLVDFRVEYDGPIIIFQCEKSDPTFELKTLLYSITVCIQSMIISGFQ
jgi:hypothetical protein